MKRKIYFIKLGGSIITDKNIPLKADFHAINSLVRQIASIKKQIKDINLIIGNGAGSFGHYFALKHKKNNNFVFFDSFGLSEINFYVKKLNLLIVEKLLEKNISAVSFSPSSFIFSKNNKLKKIFLDPIINALNQDIIPVVFGDIIFDEKLNSVIFSTERIFEELIKKLKDYYQVKTIIYCSDIDGVYDSQKKVIEKINKKNFLKIKKELENYSKKFDVTGGIIHKIKESLKIASKFKIKSVILNGVKDDRLLKFFKGEKIVSTIIE